MLRLAALVIAIAMTNLAFAAGIEVKDAYVPEPPPGLTTAALFMIVLNGTPQRRVLVRAKTDAAERCEFHTHVMSGGQMRMLAVEKIEVPAKGTTTFSPGGLHIMLLGLKAALRAGDSVPLLLTLDDGSTVRVDARVRDVRR